MQIGETLNIGKGNSRELVTKNNTKRETKIGYKKIAGYGIWRMCVKEVLKSDSLIELKMKKKEYLLEYGIQSRILLVGKEITEIYQGQEKQPRSFIHFLMPLPLS